MKGRIFCLVEEDKNVSVETPFKYLVPTLAHMASAKLIITLFSQALSEAGRDCGDKYHDLSSAGSAVRKKIPLLVPKSIQPLLYFMIDHIEREISSLDKDPVAGVIELGFYRLNDVPKRWRDIVWTCRGSIDYNKMAEKVIVDRRVRHLRPFKQFLAYMYSLPDDTSDSDINFEDEWFYMNNGAFHNANVISYWSKSDDRRIELLERWLTSDQGTHSIIHNRKEHYCSVLSKVSEKMMKCLLMKLKETMFRLFFNNLLYKDYCFQILNLMKFHKVDFNDGIEDYAWWTRLCYSITHDPPKNFLEYQQYVSICRVLYYQFFPTKKTLKMIYTYLNLIRWEIDFEQVEYIISQMNCEDKKNILYHDRKGIALSLLKKNQVNFVIEFVNLCLSNKEDRIMFQETLMKEQWQNIVSVHFLDEKVPQLVQFLQWIFENDESKIEGFKKKIFVEVFWSLLNSANFTNLHETSLRNSQPNHPKRSFSATDSFLEWCLSSKENVRKCKAFLAENLPSECEESNDLVKEEDALEREFKLWLFEYDKEKIKGIKFTKFYSKLFQLYQTSINLILDFQKDFWSDS